MNYYVGVDVSFSSTGIVYLRGDDFFYSERIAPKKNSLGTGNFISKIYSHSWFFEDAVKGYEELRDDFVSSIFLYTKSTSVAGQILSYYDIVCKCIERFYKLVEEDSFVGIGIETPFGFHRGESIKIERAFTTFLVAVDEKFKVLSGKSLTYCLDTFPPTMIKKFITGKGNAKKELVMKEIYKRWKFETDCIDISDAFAIAQYTKYMFQGGDKNEKIRTR